MAEDRLKTLEERTRYEPSDVESRVFARWERAGIFHPEPEGTPDENYSIAVPPPNVTGNLHMGHALNASIQDLKIRVARMRGQRAKWIYGKDHAGIATQRVVEQQLEAEGISRLEIGREAFVERVWEWVQEYGDNITRQFRELGASLDYEDERFTMDDDYVRAVTKVFVHLYEKGLVYRDNYMVNWDPGLRTAISDLEVEQRTVEDTLYMVDYPLESGSGSVTVATVRPETMLADTAIAVNPGDERYSRLIGEAAILPLVGRRLPIIADDYVDPEFGTGALKITPGHDQSDFDIGRRHGLEEITVIGEDGRITDAAPERFRGMETSEALDAVVAELREEGLISGTQPYVHDVPHSHRSGRRVEPLISLQWFCDMDKLARPAIDVVKDGTIRFHPEKPWTGVYLNWLENIRPWCISRQLWWGHQLPVWYRGDETYVGESAPDGEGWERDPDVLDTWFSSGLWPFATLGWPKATDELRAFYPTDVNSTARDIIFLWVARMVMFGKELTEQVPFTDVNIHSVIQAPDGRRMSKSLGTGIDPSDLIHGGARPPVYEEGGEFPAYGADALRFGLLAMSSSQDVRFNEERVKQGRDLANKLWNAARLILLRVSDVEPDPRAGGTVEDRWIVSRMERLTERVTELYDDFRFSAAALELYGGFWSELADWYLELAKPRLYEEDNAEVSAVLLVVARAHAAAAAPGDAVRDRGDLVADAGRGSRPARGGRLPGGRPRRSDRRGRRGRAGPDDRGRDRAEALSRRGGCEAEREHPRAPGRRGLRRLPRPHGSARALRVGGRCVRRWRRPGHRADPRRRRAGAAVRGVRPGGGPAPAREEARRPSQGDRARREEARQRAVRGEGAPGRGGGGAPQAGRVPRGAREARAVNFEQAEEYLLSLELFGMRFGLDRMHRLMTVLGLPQRRFASIHVVGSNGKSSTARFCAAILERHGLATGSYTSPHLRSFRERIEVGEEPVSEADFAAAVTRAAEAAQMVNRTADADDHVTQFEALTAAAYHELGRRGVEVAVIEAGLGGRFDATNVIPSKVQVLTSVSLEHTRWLGPTLEDIAAEKLAVVRDHGTLVIGALPPEVLEIAERTASERHATLVSAESIDMPLRAAGGFQHVNFGLAAAAAEAFLGRRLDDRGIEECGG